MTGCCTSDGNRSDIEHAYDIWTSTKMQTITYEEWLELNEVDKLKYMTEDADKDIRRWYFERMPPRGIQYGE